MAKAKLIFVFLMTGVLMLSGSATVCAMPHEVAVAAEAPCHSHDGQTAAQNDAQGAASDTSDCAQHGDACMVEVDIVPNLHISFAVPDLLPSALVILLPMVELQNVAAARTWAVEHPLGFSAPPVSVDILRI